MKKLLAFTLCVAVLICSLTVPVFADDYGVAPCYNNTSTTTSSFSITDDGLAVIRVSYIGYTGITTGATITVKLQKRTLWLFWNDVDEWVDTSSAYRDTFEHTKSVGSGTYRVQIEYRINGTGGATDVVTEELEYKH